MAHHIYLVTKKETFFGDDDLFVWKWGMTKQASPKKRSSFYVDCHLWEPVANAYAARAVETYVGGVVKRLVEGTELQTTLWNCERSKYDEEIQQEFPLHLLVEIVRYAVSLDMAGLNASVDAGKMNEFKAVLEEWFTLARPETPQPMWV